MARCLKCGKEVEGEFKYCPYCGAKLGVDIKTIELELEELRHKEKMTLGSFGLGIVMFILGIWLGLGFTETRIEWIGLIPYEVTYHPYAPIAIPSLIGGLASMILSGALGAYYSFKRWKLMENLKK